MTTRPSSSSSSSRSSSIPIPRTLPPISPSRNLETLIPIPFNPTSPGRAGIPPGPGNRSSFQGDSRSSWSSLHGSSSVSAAARGLNLPPPTLVSSYPARPTWGAYHITQQQRGQPFEPRRVRASPNPSNTSGPGDPAACSTSPTATRRRNSAMGIRSLSLQRHVAGVASSPSGPNSMPHLAAAPVTATGAITHNSASQFPLPSYLEYSALRHLLQTEAPPALPPSRKYEPKSVPYVVASPSPAESDDESNVGSSTPSRQRMYQLSMYDPVYRLPTRWSETAKNSNLNVSSDGRELSFIGVSCSGDKDASARTNHPIPAACGVYYFEVQITGKPPKSHLTIGFAGPEMKTQRGPGLDSNSWGYSGFDGYSYAGDKQGAPFATPFTYGDIIGCGIDFTTYKAFFTKNGTLIGHVFEGVGKNVPLHPAVGMRSNGEAVRVNFGHEPFRYDIDYHVQQQRNATWQKIISTPLDSSILAGRSQYHSSTSDGNEMEGIKQESAEGTQSPAPLTEEQTKGAINRLVLSYLMHHGYASTARAFKDHISPSKPGGSTEGASVASTSTSTAPKPQPSYSVTGGVADTDIDMDGLPSHTAIDESEADLELRTRLVGYVSSGNIDMAITETRKHYPTALDADQGMMLFKLRCRKFVELILEASELRKKMKAKAAERISNVGNGSGGLSGISVGGVGSMDGVGVSTRLGKEVGVDEEDEKDAVTSATAAVGGIEDGMGMDVDDDSAIAAATGTAAIPIPPSKRTPTEMDSSPIGLSVAPNNSITTSGIAGVKPRRRNSSAAGADTPEALQYEQALHQAINYGQELLRDYGADTRTEVKTIYNKTFGILAWEDPLAVDEGVEVAGKQARDALADDLNQAIMKSQGRPAHPPLEMLYRHTAASIMQLGRMGVGAAAYADMPREFFEN